MSVLRKLTILGATGTIGENTLDVVARHPSRFRVVALTGHRQVEKLYLQCLQFAPEYAVMLDDDCAGELRDKLHLAGSATQVMSGMAALEQVASLPQVDTVMAAIVGAAGLKPALAAAQAGKRVLLANKETLVLSGALFMDAVRRNSAELLPIDSEHNAIFQSLPRNFSMDLSENGVRRILLTASGGPFRTVPLSELENVTPQDACNHPNWKMGKKISVDSATMMNKGLEVIEAHWLFNAAPEQIEVVIHPQSVIHSMVEYADGSVLAQLGNPDMRTPIAYALGYPERIAAGVAPLDLFKIARLDFEKPDFGRFPCLGLAFQALRRGGTAPALLNAANEVAVAAFLDEKIPFKAIPAIIEQVLADASIGEVEVLADVLAADEAARGAAQRMILEKTIEPQRTQRTQRKGKSAGFPSASSASSAVKRR